MMRLLNRLLLSIFFITPFNICSQSVIQQQFDTFGYLEICDQNRGIQTFNALYRSFDDLIQFFEDHPDWAQKFYVAKERFIRSKAQKIYLTDFFGFYDESKREGRRQISFYYSIHFHEFLESQFQEFKTIHEISSFLEACLEIQKSYENLFLENISELGLETIFSSKNSLPILIKVIKYLPSYIPTKPHYDGSALTIFLDSSDDESLLLSPYKAIFTKEDFSVPQREFSKTTNQNSILLIPGALLTEFSIYPTPHIVLKSSQVRYATIAFLMRSNHNFQKVDLTPLPEF